MRIKTRMEIFHETNSEYLRRRKATGKSLNKKEKALISMERLSAEYKEQIVYVVKVRYPINYDDDKKVHSAYYASFSYSASENTIVVRHLRTLSRVNHFISYKSAVKAIEHFCVLNGLHTKAMEKHFSVVECKILIVDIPLAHTGIKIKKKIIQENSEQKNVTKHKTSDKKKKVTKK